MNIYHYVPAIATSIYLLLFLITALNRPWTKTQKCFLVYLIFASIWSVSDLLLRGPYFEQEKLTLFRLVLISTLCWAVQLYYFARFYLNFSGGFGVRLGYVFLVVISILCVVGIVPPGVVIEAGIVHPVYGWWILLWTLPMIILVIMGVYSLLKKMLSITEPEERNKIKYLVLAVVILTILGFLGVTPISKGLPFSHIGGSLSAVVLAYAVVRHELISIDLILRKALGWASVFIIGVASYILLLEIGHFTLGYDLGMSKLVFLTLSAVLVFIVIYWLQPIFLKKIDQLFYRKRYEHRKTLFDFIAHRIRGVLSLQELSEGLLTPLVKTIDCQKAYILLPDNQSGDFLTRFSESSGDVTNKLQIRKDSPIITSLHKHYLTRKDLDIKPEFRGVWATERKSIYDANIELLFPFVNRGNLVGILAVGRKKMSKYSVEDVSLVESITNQVAVSLEKELIQNELAKREKELSIINRLTRVISSSLNIQAIYDTFVLELRETFDINFAAIGLVEEEKLHFSALYSTNTSPWKIGDRIDMRKSGLEWVIVRKRGFFFNLSNDQDGSVALQQLRKSEHKSLAALPLITQGEVIGILLLASRNELAYNHDQFHMLEQLASQISASVANAQLYSRAEQRARIDELTGLSNRRHFDEIIEKEIHRHFRYGSMLSLVLMDIDHFKSYNDLLGHVNGDKLLKRIGLILEQNSRNVDMTFRYGGDEFAIVLPNTSVDNAITIAERVRVSIEQAMSSESIPITASLGIAGWPSDGINVQELVTAADQALYYAKRTGQNRTCRATQILPSFAEKTEAKPLENETLNTIYALAATIEARDRYTYGHSRKVRTYAVSLAEALNLSSDKVAVISHAALLHDIGKIGIYDTVLNKPGILNHEERELIKTHPELSRTIVANIPSLTPCLPAILHHHERWDGKGYPAGLMGEKIPLEARILTLADSFDAMTSARPYREPLKDIEVLNEIEQGAGSQFDPQLVKIFLPIAKKALGELQKV